MAYKVYPKGYDPVVASGPPSSFHINTGMAWTEKDTAHMQSLEKQAVIREHKPPPGYWYDEVERVKQ